MVPVCYRMRSHKRTLISKRLEIFMPMNLWVNILLICCSFLKANAAKEEWLLVPLMKLGDHMSIFHLIIIQPYPCFSDAICTWVVEEVIVIYIIFIYIHNFEVLCMGRFFIQLLVWSFFLICRKAYNNLCWASTLFGVITCMIFLIFGTTYMEYYAIDLLLFVLLNANWSFSSIEALLES